VQSYPQNLISALLFLNIAERKLLDTRRKKFLSISIKVVILILAFTFIFQKLSNDQSISNFRALTASLSPLRVCLVVAGLFILMLLNWFLEALKWKYLLAKVEKISTWKAVESVFCGLTLAIFTPNRIGEYGGRVFFLSPRKRIIGGVSMSIGAIGQMVVTNVCGALALLWFVSSFLDINFLINFGLTFMVAVFCSFFLLLFFNIHWIEGLLSKIKFIRPYRRFFYILASYKPHELFRILGYCILRFIVFSTQYYLLIYLLIPDIPVFPMIMIVFIIFFIQSALPSLDLLDVGVRATTATYFFGYITSYDIAIMAATASIWLINLIIPAILGSVFVLKLNFFGNSSN
jgi:uncharacterized membrane protein YbhN (UPF0104 family)